MPNTEMGLTSQYDSWDVKYMRRDEIRKEPEQNRREQSRRERMDRHYPMVSLFNNVARGL
jgi:hypothetical protein